MCEKIKTTKSDQSSFNACYGSLHLATEMAQKMCDEKGVLKPVIRNEINELKKICREAACHVNAMLETTGGQRE